MIHPVKKTIAVTTVAILAGLAYYGSYLPFRKSSLFIDAIGRLGSARTVADVEALFSVPLDAASPIGQEELVRNMTNNIFNFVAKNKDKPEFTPPLVDYVERYYRPIVARGKGMSFGQNLYILGALNEAAFLGTRDPRYLEAAQQYFEQGLSLGPKRPQFLYGLFDVYRLKGDVNRAKKIGEQILAQWPNDERARAALTELTDKTEAAKETQ